MTERIVFDRSAREIIAAVPEAQRAAVIAEWKRLGIDLDRLLPGYPLPVWYPAVQRAAACFDGSPREQLRTLGRGLTRSFTESTFGKAVAAFGRLAGPLRTLRRAPSLFRSGNNYLETTLEHEAAGDVRLRVNEVSPIGELLAGSIEELVTYTGGRNPRVELTQGTESSVYGVKWD
ncbi:MAG: DUF2378 family protein [Myxococcota bacterium]